MHTAPDQPVAKLADLLPEPPVCVQGQKAAETLTVRGLTDDTRALKPGDLFLARQARFAGTAAEAGAAALLVAAEEAMAVKDRLADHADLPIIAVDTVDQRLAGTLAERFYGHPARSLKLVGITGTNGKTTTAFIAQHLIQCLLGQPVGMIGTVQVDTGAPKGRHEGVVPAELTTPGAIETTRHLAAMRDHGCAACVLETSSHALDQGRVDHLPFTVGVFTNLTQDHLDYHANMQAYAQAKQTLFRKLPPPPEGVAVFNLDDPASATMADGCAATHLHTSLKPDNARDPGACVAINLEGFADRSTATFLGPWGSVDVTVPMTGRHNVSNALQAAAAAYALKPFRAQQLADALATAPPVPGRMQPATSPGKGNRDHPVILVDYAHTPDAVIRALTALRPVTSGKLIVVIGCGGDRDKTKRPLMAQAAVQHADQAILTSDNPRTEPPEAILQDMINGLTGEQRKTVIVEADRRTAIRAAVQNANPGDTVLLAGKGHEDYQILGTTKTHFDDREEALAALTSRTS